MSEFIQLPISEYMRNWYEEQGIVFTDFERATIFWTSCLPLEEQLEALREIADTTGDEGLKAQIEERMAHEAALKREFFDNGAKNSVYILTSEDHTCGTRYFSTVERTVAYGKAYSETAFTVGKKRLDLETDELACEGTCTYSPSGRLVSFQVSGRFYDTGEPNDTHGKPDRFEEHLLFPKHPFHRGDIVRMEGEGELGIVETPQGEKGGNWFDHWAAGGTLEIDFLDTCGGVYYDDRPILALEKVTQWDNQPEWRLMQSLQKLLLGHGHLYNLDLPSYCRRHKQREQEKEVQEDV